MTTIDEIMVAAVALGDERLMLIHGRSDRESVRKREAELRTLITQAIAEARADGAREMREAADALREDADEIFPPTDRGRQASVEVRDVVEWYSESIRALPLPDKREPVRLTPDALLGQVRSFGGGRSMTLAEFGRAIETAVLAANGMTK